MDTLKQQIQSLSIDTANEHSAFTAPKNRNSLDAGQQVKKETLSKSDLSGRTS